jgi:hypothetical protein
MDGELRLSTKNDPPRFRTLAPLAGSCPDKFPFELSKPAQYGQHETAVRGRGVSPSISKRFEACPLFGDRAQQVEEIAGRPRQTIEPRNNQYVAFRKRCHKSRKLFAVGPSTADFFLEYLLAFRRFQFGQLGCSRRVRFDGALRCPSTPAQPFQIESRGQFSPKSWPQL